MFWSFFALQRGTVEFDYDTASTFYVVPTTASYVSRIIIIIAYSSVIDNAIIMSCIIILSIIVPLE